MICLFGCNPEPLPLLCDGPGQCPSGEACYQPASTDALPDEPTGGFCVPCDSAPGLCADEDGDGYGGEFDCDDHDPDVFPTAQEVCDGRDNDCDLLIDDDDEHVGQTSTWYPDLDEDGHGDPNAPWTGCVPPDGYVSRNDDADDSNRDIYPGAPELCDDQNGAIDDDVPTWYRDQDGDGHGRADGGQTQCERPGPGWEMSNDDCDDSNPAAYPGALEVCDGADNNCDGTLDEATADDARDWYWDDDGDGYGVDSTAVRACVAPFGHVAEPGDCADDERWSYPGAAEYCDSQDNDCNGQVDDGPAVDAPWWYADADEDTYGDPSDAIQSCTQPTGYVANNLDCLPTDDTVHPGGLEVCNGLDDNCNGLIDDDDLGVDASTWLDWYDDDDGDGHGDPDDVRRACAPPPGAVANSTDCDDTDEQVYPGAPELCDGRQTNCADQAWTDDDGRVSQHTGVQWTDVTSIWGVGTPSNPVVATVSNATLRFCDGTYYVNMTANGVVQLESRSGADATILSGAGSGRVIMVDAYSIFELVGLTIRDGMSNQDGGGLSIFGPTNAVIRQAKILNSHASGRGGGLFVGLTAGKQLTIEDSLIAGNSAGSHGGGIFARTQNGALRIRRPTVVIRDNFAAGSGGGIMAVYGANHHSSVQIDGAEIVDNTADRRGGGIHLDAGVGETILDSVIMTGNQAVFEDGGGMLLKLTPGYSATVVDSLIADNEVGIRGGGIYSESPLVLTDSAVTDNRALSGDGIYTSATLECQGTAGSDPMHGSHGHEYTDIWLTGPDSELTADLCDLGTDSDGNPAGQVYVEDTDTTHTYGNDETFTLTP